MIWVVLVLALVALALVIWWVRRPRSPIGEILRGEARDIDGERLRIAREAAAAGRDADALAEVAREAAAAEGEAAGDAKRHEADDWARRR